MIQANKKNKLSFILLIVVFVVPVILAKLALDNDWFNRAATNKGELLDPVIDASALTGELPPKWRLLYVVPEDCEATCANALFSINQVFQALGKEMDRAEALAVMVENSDVNALSSLTESNQLKVLTSDNETVNKVFKDGAVDGIFVLDTMHNAVLRYATQQEQQEAVLHSRDILADMRKLLKLSRIG
ncbi:hypothetical protein [Aestuariibacter salexigens]|uniref:hypothetical protein n=1 Tax=Aestuariibacter salexigens TaxID=226010 RepID=UPI00042161CF|nr:hypothetical protein [Aestuariibacter salexigens]